MEWIAVFTGSIVDATLRQAKLDASGIDSVIPGVDGRVFDPHFAGPTFAFFDVRVRPSDEAAARAVLARPDVPLADETWTGG